MLDQAPFIKRLQHHAQQRPEQIALADRSRSLTYAQLYYEVLRLSADFNQREAPRVALALANSVQWVVTDLALLAASVSKPTVCIPIPSFFSTEQKQRLLQDSGANLLIDADGYHHLPQRQNPPELPLGTVKITYTSGSTGDPKGVCLSADNMQRTIEALDQRIGNLPVARHLSLMPLAVLLENIAGVYLSLWRGYQVDLRASEELGVVGAHKLDLQRFYQALNQLKPHSLITTPGLVKALLHGIQSQQLQEEQLLLVAVGGARLLPELERLAQQLKLPLVQGYGLSEFASVVCFNTPNRVDGSCSFDPAAVGTVGHPLAHAEVGLQQGEVVVTGNAMLGYLNDPSSWYQNTIRTGDWGQFDSQGRLIILGRKKHIIVTEFGRNVDPEWLEAELTQLPGIQQAAVFGSEELPLTALLVLHPEQAFSDAQINAAIARLNQRLPDYAQLQQWHRAHAEFSLNNQQLTGTGRIRRAAIADAYADYLSPKRLSV